MNKKNQSHKTKTNKKITEMSIERDRESERDKNGIKNIKILKKGGGVIIIHHINHHNRGNSYVIRIKLKEESLIQFTLQTNSTLRCNSNVIKL